MMEILFISKYYIPLLSYIMLMSIQESNKDRITLMMDKPIVKKINAKRAKIIASGKNKSFSSMVNDILVEALK